MGDGSVNNAHFLSSLNMAQYAEFRGFKCPLVFAISDNNLSISLPGLFCFVLFCFIFFSLSLFFLFSSSSSETESQGMGG